MAWPNNHIVSVKHLIEIRCYSSNPFLPFKKNSGHHRPCYASSDLGSIFQCLGNQLIGSSHAHNGQRTSGSSRLHIFSCPTILILIILIITADTELSLDVDELWVVVMITLGMTVNMNGMVLNFGSLSSWARQWPLCTGSSSLTLTFGHNESVLGVGTRRPDWHKNEHQSL